MDVKFVIGVETAGAQKAIDDFDKALESLGETSGTTGKSAGGMAGAVALGGLAATAATKIFGFMTDQIASSKDEFLASEKSAFMLAATLKNLEMFSEASEKRFSAFAEEIQKVTTVEDDAAKAAMSLGLRMGISADQIEDATKSAIGLSKSFGIDLNSAMKMVSQATEGEFAMMGRYVPQLRAAESVTDKMAIATKVMADGFNIAKAEVETTGGKMQQTQNAINNTKETIGELAAKFESLTMKAITPCVNILADFCAWLDQADQRAAKNTTAKQWQENKSAFEAAAAAAGILEREQKKLFEEHGNISKTSRGIAIYAEALDDLIDKYPAAAKGYNDFHKAQYGADLTSKHLALSAVAEAKAQDEARKKREAANKSWAEHNKQLKAARAAMSDMPGSIKKVAQAHLEQLPVLNDTYATINKISLELDFASLAAAGFSSQVKESNQATIDGFLQVLGETQNFLGAIQGLYQTKAQQKRKILDDEYNEQRYRIEQSKMSEEEKIIALSELEELYTMKSEALQKSAAKKEKGVAIMMATLNIAQGITKAFAQGGITGFITAALIAAAGAIQIATIKAQPLAKGAIFNRPTLLPGMNGGTYQVAEPGSGGVEIVATPANIRKAIGLDSGRGGGNRYSITIPIYMGAKKMQTVVVDLVEDAAQTGRLCLVGKAVR